MVPRARQHVICLPIGLPWAIFRERGWEWRIPNKRRDEDSRQSAYSAESMFELVASDMGAATSRGQQRLFQSQPEPKKQEATTV
ncbi:hypothetical protein AAFF_G00279920 [Aldrovandia affinis]|uniref:Uncharacterized protein n=1 Tax=Aldrovandia affinis TaxID=143900 RepID=A0AAD7SSL7_9TELE|nr:hypothetical protein AAFF_G00279920 [Aldrovandia affinis]